MRTNIIPMVTDNIGELLAKIVEFTDERHRVLKANIEQMHVPGYVPMDLPVEEFAELLELAIVEHKRNKRLLLCDTYNVKFGHGGQFEAQALADEYAQELLRQDANEYLEFQLKKLSENSLNQRVAAELFKQKQGMGSLLSKYEI